jgi:hypothetical protein
MPARRERSPAVRARRSRTLPGHARSPLANARCAPVFAGREHPVPPTMASPARDRRPPVANTRSRSPRAHRRPGSPADHQRARRRPACAPRTTGGHPDQPPSLLAAAVAQTTASSRRPTSSRSPAHRIANRPRFTRARLGPPHLHRSAAPATGGRTHCSRRSAAHQYSSGSFASMSRACARAQVGHSQRVAPRSRSATHARASAVHTRWSRCREQRTHVTAISSATS